MVLHCFNHFITKLQLVYLKSYQTLFTANVTTTDYLDEFVPVISKKEEKSFKINGAVYSIIGLAATSVLLIILYLCTHLLEKC